MSTVTSMIVIRAVVVAIFLSVSNAVSLNQRATLSQYCNTATNICYVESSSTASNPIYRIAIPDANAAPFDTLLQIIAPVSLGWAGFAWGGAMTLNPLTVAWPNGNSVTVSSRWST